MCCCIRWCKKNLANCKILLNILTEYKEIHWLVEVVRHYWRSLSQSSAGHDWEQVVQGWVQLRFCIFEDRDTPVSLCYLFQCFTTFKIILEIFFDFFFFFNFSMEFSVFQFVFLGSHSRNMVPSLSLPGFHRY